MTNRGYTRFGRGRVGEGGISGLGLERRGGGGGLAVFVLGD
jgi:hypothetical protein